MTKPKTKDFKLGTIQGKGYLPDAIYTADGGEFYAESEDIDQF